MLATFLVRESTVHADGSGSAVDAHAPEDRTCLLTLGITNVIEQESLTLTIGGSKDGNEWLPQPVASFPQKFYCGISSIFLDLRSHPEILFVRAEWKTNRWGRGEKTPLFRFYLFIESAPVTAG